MSEYDAILITGPTASGKSALALEWAMKTNGVVVNADSMQVYDTLRVLTARPSTSDMADVAHTLYGHVPASTPYSTGSWLREIESLLKDLKLQGRMPVITGGTGLYFKALTEGLADMPAVPDEIRAGLRSRLEEEGPESLHRELAEIDPETAFRLKPADGQRIVRALEIFKATGKPLSLHLSSNSPALIDASRAQKFVVLPERPVLAARINRRFEGMLASGAVEEVEALVALGLADTVPVMKAIGVPEIAAMLRGEMSIEDVRERGAAATRQYAKRQMTWFRNQMDDTWQRITS